MPEIVSSKTAYNTLAPIDLDTKQWNKRIKHLNLSDISGQIIEYNGNVLESSVAEFHTIKFECPSTLFRPSELRIHVFASTSTKLTARLNGKNIEEIELPPMLENPIKPQSIIRDFTQWSEVSNTTMLELEFQHYDLAGAITILFKEINDTKKDFWATAIVQPKATLYAAQVWLFLLAVWGTLLSLIIWATTYFTKASETPSRLFIVILPILGWLASVIGLPELIKIPVKSSIRYFFKFTKNFRAITITLLLALLVPLCIRAGTIVKCLSMRYQYSKLITEALEKENSPEVDDLIRRAFILAPWRKEAQVLFEHRAYKFRESTDLNGYKDYVRKFITNNEVIQAIDDPKTKFTTPYFLEKGDAVENPIIWYATLLPDTEIKQETMMREKAVSLLVGIGEIEAKTFQKTIQMELAYSNYFSYRKNNQDDLANQAKLKIDETAATLQTILTTNNRNEISQFHTYQSACDTLACYQILIRDSSDEATHWFQKELEARKYQNRNSRWLKPPEKLMLYYMFTSEGGAKTILNSPASKNALAILNFNSSFQSAFNQNFLIPYSQFKEREYWGKGTIMNEDIHDSLLESLKKDWRY